jgi:hypothetical protein
MATTLRAALAVSVFAARLLGQNIGAPAAARATPKPALVKPAATRLNAASPRNENVAIYQIDTNAIKEANIRIGTTATAILEPAAETQHYAGEHGRPAAELLALRPATPAPGWHGEGFWWHQNSVFNARTFFQVGAVQPSHRNLWGGRLTGGLGRLGALTAVYAQSDVRGMVNGNVLVPLEDERTPRTNDPASRALIEQWLAAYPAQLPNRTDFDIRALNTNSPQRIDAVSGTLRLDAAAGSGSKLIASHTIDRSRTLAFQLVAGQNPDTNIHTQRSRLTWVKPVSPATQLQLGAAFTRVRSALVSPPGAVGPRVRFGYQIEELGPDSMFPIDRATNSFRYGFAMTHLRGKHNWSWGADYTRFQLNGIESANQRGYYQFANNFGRTAIENFLYGTPSTYEIALGELSRGYRNYSLNGYVADRWQAHARLQVYYGARWFLDSRPVEVHAMERIPYDTDWNNFSPRLSLAWQAGKGWVARAAYTASFSQILPVTYQQIRNNPPHVTYVMVADPDLVDPLEGIDLDDPNGRYSPTWLAPELAAPYTHQYSLSLEHPAPAGALVRVQYIGSRSIKLLNSFIMNRAEPVPGIPLTTATVNLRRPDPRYFETRTVVNGGVAWFDAGKLSVDLPQWRGVMIQGSYVFSKALDEGPDFSATAANRDILTQRSQWQYESFKDRKGLSNFDSTHSLVVNWMWEIPSPSHVSGWVKAATRGWQIAGVNLWKKGTPVSLFMGSDSPGFGNVDGGPSDRPSIIDPTILGRTIGHPDEAPLVITKARFTTIEPGGRRGNLGRSTFRKARIWNWNAALTRQFRLANDWTAQLRAETYNLSNTPQFDEPQRNYTSPSFGKITNTLNDGRVFQVGIRLIL